MQPRGCVQTLTLDSRNPGPKGWEARREPPACLQSSGKHPLLFCDGTVAKIKAFSQGAKLQVWDYLVLQLAFSSPALDVLADTGPGTTWPPVEEWRAFSPTYSAAPVHFLPNISSTWNSSRIPRCQPLISGLQDLPRCVPILVNSRSSCSAEECRQHEVRLRGPGAGAGLKVLR